MTVGREVTGFVELNHFTLFIKNDQDLLLRFSLNFQCVKSTEFKERTKETTDVGVDYNVSLRTDCATDRFSASRILSNPATRASGNHNLIFRIVPFGIRLCCIPEESEIKPFPADKPLFHLFADWFLVDLKITYININRPVVISLLNRCPPVAILLDEFVCFLEFFELHMGKNIWFLVAGKIRKKRSFFRIFVSLNVKHES